MSDSDQRLAELLAKDSAVDQVAFMHACLEVVRDATRADYAITDLRIHVLPPSEFQALQPKLGNDERLLIGGTLHQGIRGLLKSAVATVSKTKILSHTGISKETWSRYSEHYQELVENLWSNSREVFQIDSHAPKGSQFILIQNSGLVVSLVKVHEEH